MRDDRLADEELLSTGPEPTSRRRALMIGGVLLLVAGLVVGMVVSSRPDHRHASSSATSSRAPHPVAPTATESPVAGGSPGAAPAVAMNGYLYVIREGMLNMHSLTRSYINQAVIGQFRQPDAGYVLIGDAARRRIWVVQSLAPSWTAYEYDAATLDPIGHKGAGGDVVGAAVLDGGLYVDTSVGVVRVVGPRTSRLQATGMRGGRAIVADPARGRLLLLDLDGTTAQIRAERPGSPHPIAAARTALVAMGGFAVVGDRIWAAGFGERGALLLQLDPRTLRPLGHSPLEAELGPGAVIVASGRQDFLVRSGAGGNELWCVDGRSGATRQTWTHAAGPVVLDELGPGPRVYTVSAGFIPRPLGGTGCRG